MPQSIFDFDWANTPLGPRTQWAPALKTTYDLMMSTGFAVCATWGPEQTLLYNSAYIPFLGARHPEALGRPISEVWHDVWEDIRPLIESALRGEPVYLEDLHLVMSRNGYPEDTYWTFSYSPLRDGEEITGILDIATETTARIAAEKAADIVMREAAHRLKNTLAVVQAIAQQSLRGVTEREAVSGFEQRLVALASSHDVLLLKDWDSADLAMLIDKVMGKIVSNTQYVVAGPQLDVSTRSAQIISLVLHELTTNAIKHGALSRPEGRVEVIWRVEGEQIILTWRERGGPEVAPPVKKGFGSKLINGGLTGSGGASTHYEAEGLSVTFTAAARSLLEN